MSGKTDRRLAASPGLRMLYAVQQRAQDRAATVRERTATFGGLEAHVAAVLGELASLTAALFTLDEEYRAMPRSGDFCPCCGQRLPQSATPARPAS